MTANAVGNDEWVGIDDIVVSSTASGGGGNTAPTITSNGGATQNLNVVENTTAVTTIAATDTETPAGLTYALSGPDAARFTIGASSGVIAFAPAPNFESPTDAGTNNVYNVTVTVTDGGTPGLTDTQDLVITVTNVNDVAPVNTIPATQTTAFNTAVTFSTANSNVISVADSDSTTLQATLTVTNGTLALSGIAGLTGNGSGTASLTYSGTAAALNTALQGAIFTPTGGFSGGASIQLVTSDLGNPGGGTPLTDTDTINITVNAAVNQPTLSIPTNITGAVGASIQIPVILNTNGAPPDPITGLDLAIVYDSAVLTINSIVAGPALTGGWTVTSNFASDPGKIGVDASTGTGVTTAINGQVILINATIKGTSPLGASPINLVMSTTIGATAPMTIFTRLNDGATSSLMLSPAPTDGAGDANVDGTVTVTAAPNTAPMNTVPGTISGTEDTNVTFNAGNAITVADSDSASVTTVVSVTSAAVGTFTHPVQAGVTVAGDGLSVTFTGTPAAVTSALTTLVFMPALNRNTAAPISVATSDGSLSDTDSITINLTAVNDAPTITSNGNGAPASLNVAEGSTAVTTVVATDVDTPTTITYSVTGPDAGLFTIVPVTGVLTFTAAPNFEAPGDVGANNVYNVTVVATDNGTPVLNDTQDLTITVTNVNEVPTITSNGGGASAATSVAENSTAVTTVVATDLDVPAGLVYSISGPDAGLFTIVPATGVLTFTTAPNFEAPGDTGANNVYDITITVTDNGAPGLTDVQTLAITVTNVNEAPTITSNGAGATAAINVAEGTTAVATVMAGDVDASSTITYSITGTDAALFSIVPATGVLTFLTAPNFESPTDSGANGVYEVTVVATDNGTPGLTDNQALSITVTNVNEAPVNTIPGDQNTAFNTPLVFNTANSNLISIADVDAGVNPVQVTIAVTNGTVALSGIAGLSGSGTGTASLTYSGTLTALNMALNGLTFTPTAGYSGPASFQLVTSDLGNTGTGGTLTDTDTVNITVSSAAPQSPVNTVPGTVTGTEDTLLPLSGISVIDTDSVSITTTVTLPAGVGTLSATSGGGSVTPVINGPGTVVTFTGSPAAVTQALGTLSFMPVLNRNSDDGLITVNVATTDGSLSDSDNFTISLTPVNDAPVAVNDTLPAVNEDAAPIIFDASLLLANDLDKGAPNESAQTLSFVDVNTGSAVGGTVSRVGNTITFTPTANFFGTASFTYTITDNGTPALTSTATVAIPINSVNDAPVAVADTLPAVNEDAAPVVFDASLLLANDLDKGAPNENSQTLTFVDVNTGSAIGGTVSRVGTTITFTPAADFFGTASFTYTITDNGTPALTSTATVSIPINSVNDAPSFMAGPNLTVPFNAPAQSLAWASAIAAGPANESGQVVSFLIVNDHPEYFTGPITISSTGILEFTPATGATGIATLSVTAQDNGGTSPGVDTSAPVIFTITIDAAPTAPPVANDLNLVALFNSPVSGTLSASDPDSPTLTYAISMPPALGTITAFDPATGAFTYTPTTGATGLDLFDFTVSDGTSTDAGTVRVVIQGSTAIVIPLDGDLTIIGTNAADNIVVSRAGTDLVRVRTSAGTANYPLTGRLIINTGDSDDVVQVSGITNPATVDLGGGNDYYAGTSGDETIIGGPGADTLIASGGNNIVWGDVPGEDELPGGRDSISGGSGNDTFYGGGGDDTLAGFAGNDYLSGGAGNDNLIAGEGDDRLFGGSGNDSLSGEAGNDILSGGSGNDVLLASAGNDIVIGGTGADSMNGNAGLDVLIAGDTTNAASTVAGDANDLALIALLSSWLASQPAGLATPILAGNDGAIDRVYGDTGNDDFYVSATDNTPDFSLTGYYGTDRRVNI
ncbi:tandem-95 repeat protein [Anatilimnocola sp. NA78]|uniref:tandem-95 repeat protein n=1 Tax=Anatilimnocola sp. NA78 TaxID=3415683 RepID=UPI003CE5C7D8